MLERLRKLLGRKPKPPKEIPVLRSIKNGDNLTEYELHEVGHGKCPDCGIGKLLEGPQGGLCMNVQCNYCGSEFNTVPGIFGERISDPSPTTTKKG